MVGIQKIDKSPRFEDAFAGTIGLAPSENKEEMSFMKLLSKQQGISAVAHYDGDFEKGTLTFGKPTIDQDHEFYWIPLLDKKRTGSPKGKWNMAIDTFSFGDYNYHVDEGIIDLQSRMLGVDPTIYSELKNTFGCTDDYDNGTCVMYGECNSDMLGDDPITMIIYGIDEFEIVYIYMENMLQPHGDDCRVMMEPTAEQGKIYFGAPFLASNEVMLDDEQYIIGVYGKEEPSEATAGFLQQ